MNVKNILKDEVIFDIKKGTSLNNISEKKFKEQRYYADCARKGVKPNLVL